jgi:hypothetical protein
LPPQEDCISLLSNLRTTCKEWQALKALLKAPEVQLVRISNLLFYLPPLLLSGIPLELQVVAKPALVNLQASPVNGAIVKETSKQEDLRLQVSEVSSQITSRAKDSKTHRA